MYIDRTEIHGISNDGPNSEFNNAGLIVVGASATIGSSGVFSIGKFSNQSGGEIRIDQVKIHGIFSANPDSEFENAGLIVIGGTAAIGEDGIRSWGLFTNQSGGVLRIDKTGSNGIANYIAAADFKNAGLIVVGASATIGSSGVLNSGKFSNQLGGEIRLDRATFEGIENSDFFADFKNDGLIEIGRIVPPSRGGLRNANTFVNTACGQIYAAGSFLNISSFTNAGFLMMDTKNPHSNTGTFTNNGAIGYPQGNPIPNVINNALSSPPISVCEVGSVSPAMQLGGANGFTVEATWYKDKARTMPAGTYNPSTNTFTNSSLATGPHSVFFTVTDNATSCTMTLGIEVMVNPLPAASIMISNSAVFTGSNASALQGAPTVELSATNCAGTLVWTGASNGSGSSIAVATTTPGTFTYSVQCQVGECISEPTSVSVTIIPLLTATVAASPEAILTNQSSTLTATVAGGTPGYAYEWTGPGTLANANTATASVSDLTPGEKVFTVTITDATAPIAQVVTKSVSVFVTQANQAPVVTDIANRTSTAGNAFSVTISDAFSDPDNDALTYAATGLPAGLALSQGVISGVPTTFGTYTVNVTATDPGMLSASSSFTIKVLQGPLRMLDPIYNCTMGQLTVRVIAGNINPIEYYVESVSKGWESANSFVVEEKKIGKELKLRARQRASDGKGYDEVELQFTLTVCGANPLQILAPTYDCTTGIITLRATAGNGNPVEYTVSDIAKAWSSQTTYQLEEKQIGKELKLTVRQKDLDGKKYIESEIKFTPVSCPSTQLVMLAPEYDCSTGTLKLQVSGGNGNPIEYEVSSVSKGWESQNTFTVESKQLGKEVKLRARQQEIEGKKYNEVELRFTPASCTAARIGLPETERVTELILTVLGNPVSDQVRFEIRGAEGQPVQLRLLDLQGRIIETRSVSAAAEVEEHTFDVQRQASGILLLQATTPSQQKLVKVLKQ